MGGGESCCEVVSRDRSMVGYKKEKRLGFWIVF